MATPEEVANDLAAWANRFDRSDVRLASICRDAARLIRRMLDRQCIDGRTYYGLHKRLNDQVFMLRMEDTAIARSLGRGLRTLEQQRRELVRTKDEEP